MAGFIKLHRKLLKWGWYSDANTFRVFMHLLLIASFEDNEFRGHKLKPGQAVIGRKRLAKDLNMSEQSVRTALAHLKLTNEITIKTTNKFSVITIENWEKYQLADCTTNQQDNQPRNQQSTNNQPTTNHTQECKEVKNVKNKEDIYSDVPGELKEAFMEWVAMRKKIKKPIESKRAVTMALNRLKELASTTDEMIQLIDNATLHCWQSFYKENIDESHSRNNQDVKGGAGADEVDYGEGWG